MASVGEGDCHKDPNFAVICSFLDKYGSTLGLPLVTYSDLQTYLEDTTNDVSRTLIDIHVRLLRRIGKSTVNSERFEKSIIKFCHHFSEFDAWEVESYGYKHAQLGTKLRILKNLLECQFDYNIKFKEKVNESSADNMRFLPIGRDKEGLAYWYFLDQDLNLLVYKEEQDDEDADTWQLVCSNRNQLASLVSTLQQETKVEVKEEDDKTSTSGSQSSKEGSPCKEIIANCESVQLKLEKIEIKQEAQEIVKTDQNDECERDSTSQQPSLATDGKDIAKARMGVEEEEVRGDDTQEKGMTAETHVKCSKDAKDRSLQEKEISDGQPEELKSNKKPPDKGKTASQSNSRKGKKNKIVQDKETSPDQSEPGKEKSLSKDETIRDDSCSKEVDARQNVEVEGRARIKISQPSISSPETKVNTDMSELGHAAELHAPFVANAEPQTTDQSATEEEAKNVRMQVEEEEARQEGAKEKESKAVSQEEEIVKEAKEVSKGKGEEINQSGGREDKTGTLDEHVNETEEISQEGEKEHMKETEEISQEGEKEHMKETEEISQEGEKEHIKETEKISQEGEKEHMKETEEISQEGTRGAHKAPVKENEEINQASETGTLRKEQVKEEEIYKESVKEGETDAHKEQVEEMEVQEKEERRRGGGGEKATAEIVKQKDDDEVVQKGVAEGNKSDRKAEISQALTEKCEAEKELLQQKEHGVEQMKNEADRKEEEEKGSEPEQTKDESDRKEEKRDMPEQTKDKSDRKEDKGDMPEEMEKEMNRAEEEMNLIEDEKARSDNETKETEDKSEIKNGDANQAGDRTEAVEGNNGKEVREAQQVTDKDTENTEPAEDSAAANKKSDQSGEETRQVEERRTEAENKEIHVALENTGDETCVRLTEEETENENKLQNQRKEEVKEKDALSNAKCEEIVDQHKEQEAGKELELEEMVSAECENTNNMVNRSSSECVADNPVALDSTSSSAASISHSSHDKTVEGENLLVDHDMNTAFTETERLSPLSMQSDKQCGNTVSKSPEQDVGTICAKETTEASRGKESDEKESSGNFGSQETSQTSQKEQLAKPEEKQLPLHESVSDAVRDQDAEITDTSKIKDEETRRTSKKELPVESQDKIIPDHESISNVIKEKLVVTEGPSDEAATIEQESVKVSIQETTSINYCKVPAIQTTTEGKSEDAKTCEETVRQSDSSTADMESSSRNQTDEQEEESRHEEKNELAEECDEVVTSPHSGPAEEQNHNSELKESSTTVANLEMEDKEDKDVGEHEHVSSSNNAGASCPSEGSHSQKDPSDKKSQKEEKVLEANLSPLSCDSHKGKDGDLNSIGIDSKHGVGEKKSEVVRISQGFIQNKPASDAADLDASGEANNETSLMTVESEVIYAQANNNIESNCEPSNETSHLESEVSSVHASNCENGGTSVPSTSGVKLPQTAESGDKVCNSDKQSEVEENDSKRKTEASSTETEQTAPQVNSSCDTSEDDNVVSNCSKQGGFHNSKSHVSPKKAEVVVGTMPPTDSDKEKIGSCSANSMVNGHFESEDRKVIPDVKENEKAKLKGKDKKKGSQISDSPKVEESITFEKSSKQEEIVHNDRNDHIAESNETDDRADEKPRENKDESNEKGSKLPDALSVEKSEENKDDSANVESTKTQIGESQRKLKRSAPEPASDEQIDSGPDGKRARQATRTRATRGGRNAAARGRAARLAQKDSESEDSETPLSQVRGKGRGAKGRGRRGGRGRSRGGGNQKPGRDAAAEEEEVISDQTNGKRAKKKKPDSSSEAISEEEVTPAKKGRNQSQPVTASKSRGGKGSKRGGGRGGAAKAVSATAAEETSGAGVRRSLRVRQAKARRPPSSPSEESEETSSQDESEEEEEDDRNKDFLDASFTPEEESGDEEFRPTGRNFQRQAARTNKEDNEEVINDDTPCVKCGKYNHPEMILLCDRCDAGYHTACLRPPLMLIPDGDWFCPPCEHAMLVAKLLDCLQSFDNAMKKKDRLTKRQERLAYVGISISNILHGERKGTLSGKFDRDGKKIYENEDKGDEEEAEENGSEAAEKDEEESGSSSVSSSSYESEPELKRTYRSERLAIRQAQKRSRRERHKRRRTQLTHSPEVEVLSKRTCRTRNAVSYQFKEFDELISNAIEDDKPFRKEKPPGITRGKDMSNILGASDEEDEKIRQRDGESGQPPPVVKKKTKRKLTMLESDEEDQDEDESEEFKISEEEDSEATEIEGEEDDEDEEIGSSDSGAWKPKKTWYNSQTARRPSRRVKNFVVDDEDYDSDENASKRRSTRNSNRNRIHYDDWDSEEEETEEEEEASFSDYSSEYSGYNRKSGGKQRKQTPPSQKKSKQTKKLKEEIKSEDSQSDSSIARKRKILRKLIKKRRKDESLSEETEEEAEVEKVEKRAGGNTKKHGKGEEVEKVEKRAGGNTKKHGKGESDSDFTLSEHEDTEDSEASPKFKKKNVLRSSDEEAGGVGEEEAAKILDENDQDTSSVAVKAEEIRTEATVEQVDRQPQLEPEPVKPAGRAAAAKGKAAKPKPTGSAKGKKRGEKSTEESLSITTEPAVPGKVRRVSGSDKEANASTEPQPLLPLSHAKMPPSQGKKKQPARRQRSKSKEGGGDEVSCPPEKKVSTLPMDNLLLEQPTLAASKPASRKKKKTVPNFLDVHSEDDGDEQQKQAEGSAAPQLADGSKSETTLPPSQTAQSNTNLPPGEGSPQVRLTPLGQQSHFQNPSYGIRPGPYAMQQQQQSGPGLSPYSHGAHMGSPQNATQPRPEMGSSAHNTNIPGPCGLSGYTGQIPRHTNSGSAPHMRAPHPAYGGGPRPNAGHHPYPQGPQNLEPGQVPPNNVNQGQQRMPHPSFQGLPPSRQTPPGSHPVPSAAHMGPGMGQHSAGIRPPFHMSPQHAHQQNMGGEKAMGGYPHNFGAGRMPSPQDMTPGQGGMRHPYYGMQSSPPHNAGQHYPGQYPPGMGPLNMSSPLTSMGQMTKNLIPGPGLQSGPSGGGEGPRERRQTIGSPPQQESSAGHDKPDTKEGKLESTDRDTPDKPAGKGGKKRATSSKTKKKGADSNPPVSPPSSHNKLSAAPANQRAAAGKPERLPEPGQIMPSNMGPYRPPNQPCMPQNMPQYQMPYMHSQPHPMSLPNMSSQHGPGAQVPYMPPSSAPMPAHQGGSNLPSKQDTVPPLTENENAGKGNVSDKKVEVSSNEQRPNMSPYPQNSQMPSSRARNVSPSERRSSMSPSHQSEHGQDLSSGPHRPPNQGPGAPPSSQGHIPPASKAPEMPINAHGPPASQGHGMPPYRGQNMPLNSHGHNMSQYSHGQMREPCPPTSTGPYYNSGPYYPPYVPSPSGSMPPSNAWGPNMPGYGQRFAPNMYPYGVSSEHMNQGARMAPSFAPQGPSDSQTGIPISTMQSGPRESRLECPPSNEMSKAGEKPGSVMSRRTSSNESQSSITAESGPDSSQQKPESDSMPLRNSDAQQNAETPTSAGSQTQTPASLPFSSAPSLSSSSSTSSSSSSTATSTTSTPRTSLSQTSEIPQQPAISSPSTLTSSVESTSPQLTSLGLNQSHQITSSTNMGPLNSWSATNAPMQYPLQHMGQWPSMGGPGHYDMRQYGGPGMMGHPQYPMGPSQGSIDSQQGSSQGHMGPSQGQRPYMHSSYPSYESGFQPPHPGMRQMGPGADYRPAGPRPGYNPEYQGPPSFRSQMHDVDNNPRGPEGSHSKEGGREDQAMEGNTAPKAKKAKTQKKTAKDNSAVPVRGKGGKGRGRGRGAFMIDNLLQKRGVEGEEEGEDSSDIKDIVSYVTTDEYFKQQTSS